MTAVPGGPGGTQPPIQDPAEMMPVSPTGSGGSSDSIDPNATYSTTNELEKAVGPEKYNQLMASFAATMLTMMQTAEKNLETAQKENDSNAP